MVETKSDCERTRLCDGTSGLAMVGERVMEGGTFHVEAVKRPEGPTVRPVRAIGPGI